MKIMKNSGFKISGNVRHDTEKEQYIVIGVARGGTSAVAASLKAVGVPLSGNFSDTNYEDIEMSKAFRSKNWRHFKRLILGYEEQYLKFAWKLPDSHTQLKRINKYFSNPHFIVVYRDIFSIANRKNLTLNIDTIEAMSLNLSIYQRIIKFIRRENPRVLHVSYEKMLQDKIGYAEELAKFCNIEITEELLTKVCAVIEPTPDKYAHWCSKVHLKEIGFEGHIDQITEKYIVGWIINMDNDIPVIIDLFINNEFILEFSCEIFREDLISAGKSSLGKAGFIIPLDDIVLQKSDEIHINPKGNTVGLVAFAS